MCAMTDGFKIDDLRRNLGAIMKRRELKPTTVSLLINKRNPSLIKDLMEKTSDTRLSTVYNLAEVIGVEPAELLRSDIDRVAVGPTLFVKGEVAAGNWKEAFEWAEEDWQTMTGRPDITAEPMHRFFLRVCGDSMNLLYPEGTFIECVSTFGRAEPLPGKRVVVVRRRADGLIEATVKEMVETDGEIWFTPRSTNPAHQAFKASEPGEEIEEVSVVAVVVSSVRPE